MMFWVKDVGGYSFDPSLKFPQNPSTICGDIAYANKMCGEYKYCLRVFLAWHGYIDLYDNSLTVLYIKALLTYQKYRW